MAYIYHERVHNGLSILFFDPNLPHEDDTDYQAVLDILSSFSRLDYAFHHQIFPYMYQEGESETEQRLHFDVSRWQLIACEVNEGDGVYQTALICRRSDPDHAYVLTLDAGRILVAMHEGWMVEQGKQIVFDSVNYPWDYGLSDIIKIRSAQGSSSTLTHPSFSAYQKSKPQKLDTPKEVEEEDEEPDGPIEIVRPSFVAGGSKKPRNLNNLSFQEKPKEKKAEDNPKAQTVPISSAFTPKNSEKPRNLDAEFKSVSPREEDEETIILDLEPYRPPAAKGRPKHLHHWKANPRFFYQPAEGMRGILYNPRSYEIVEQFDAVREGLSKISSIYISEFCIFAPDFPDYDVETLPAIRDFKIDDWRLLVLHVDEAGTLRSVLLADKEDPRFCLVLAYRSKSWSVFALLTCGAILPDTEQNSFSLFKRYEIAPAKRPLPVEPQEQKPLPKEKPKPVEEPAPEAEPKPIPKKEPLIEKRRVYVTSSFERDCEDFHETYFKLFDEDLRHTMAVLLSSSESDLNDYLSRNDGKNIFTEGSLTIRKFRFGTCDQYAGARLFFCRGYDLPGENRSDDLLLLGISRHDEHDDQFEIAEGLYRRLKEGREFIYRKFLPQGEEGEVERLPQMSWEQYGLLEDVATKMPMAFLGSAGTGKTLLSIRHGIAMGKQGKRVLYLTYQRRLCDEVRRQFALLGAEKVESMTYRDFCRLILGAQMGEKMVTKEHFRTWFFHYAKHTYVMKKKLRAFGDSAEDQFRVCYTFYRGIIDGTYADYAQGRNAMMSKERFLDLTHDELGYSIADKETIYEVAKAYENSLREEGGYTDNQLAVEILKLGGGGASFDAIIIDEYQDLTELQFASILYQIKPSDPLPLFIYGDENQAINPTLFDFIDANKMLKAVFGENAQFERTQVGSSYRSGPTLVHYINDINRIKREAIGARRYGDDEEVSLRRDDADLLPVLVKGKRLLSELVETCAQTDRDVVFIFPSSSLLLKMRDEFKKKANTLVQTRFLTVEDAKGMQWDSVVLVDFFSDSRKLFDGMLGEERLGHRSTVHRMLFNRFYVALTRAENRIIVYESDPSPLIEEEMLKGLVPLQDLSELSSYFEGHMREGDWMKRGDEQFAAKRYDRAAHYYSRSSVPEAAVALEKAIAYARASSHQMGEKERIALYLGNQDYESMLDFYHDLGKDTLARFLEALLEGKASAKEARRAYEKLPASLSEGERTMFLDLIISLLGKTIDEDIAKLKRRYS